MQVFPVEHFFLTTDLTTKKLINCIMMFINKFRIWAYTKIMRFNNFFRWPLLE